MNCKQKARELVCSSKCYRRKMLLKTPIKIVIDKKFYGNTRQKITIRKTCPKKRQHFFFKENRTECFVQKYHAKVLSKTLAKIRSQGKTVMKYSSWNFVRKSCLKHRRHYLNTLVKSTVQKAAHNTVKSHIRKRQNLKARLEKLFRNAARNTAVNGFRKKDLSKNSSKSTN